MRKYLLLIICLIFTINSASSIDWTDVGSPFRGDYIKYDSPFVAVVPRAASNHVNLASTNYIYNIDGQIDWRGDEYIDGDGSGFGAIHQIAIASVMGLSRGDIEANPTLVIDVDCPQGFNFVSSSNPAFKRPFSIVVVIDYAIIRENTSEWWQSDNSGYYEVDYQTRFRIEDSSTRYVDIGQTGGSFNDDYEGAKFWASINVLLELEGEVAGGVLRFDDGTEMPLADLDDYTATVTLSVSCTANTGINPASTITIPFSGFYDSRLGSSADNGGNLSALSVRPTARASTINLLEDQGETIEVASIDFLRLISSKNPVSTSGEVEGEEYFAPYKSRIFLSSSANPDVNAGEFRFIHNQIAPGGIIDDRNSIRYTVRATDNDTWATAYFDGTMTALEIDNAERDVIVPNNRSSASHGGYGTEGSTWQEYDGTIEIILDKKENTMYSGAYHSYVYIHVFTEDGSHA